VALGMKESSIVTPGVKERNSAPCPRSPCPRAGPVIPKTDKALQVLESFVGNQGTTEIQCV